LLAKDVTARDVEGGLGVIVADECVVPGVVDPVDLAGASAEELGSRTL
jgi:hypothetical protein